MRTDKPITTLRPSVSRADSVVPVNGTAVCHPGLALGMNGRARCTRPGAGRVLPEVPIPSVRL